MTDNHDDPFDEPSSVSFFAQGPDAGAAVCDSVWQLFAKDSTANGFDCRSRASIVATKALAKRRAEGDVTAGAHPWKAKAAGEVRARATAKRKGR